MSDYLDPGNEELLKDFFEEAEMQIEMLEQNILFLENDPNNRDAVDEIFRAAHTLKGSSATVEMDEIAGFTHLVENLLDEIRSDKVQIDSALVDSLLESIDVIKSMIHLRIDGKVFSKDISALKNKLSSHLKKQDAVKPEKKEPVKTKVPVKEEKGDGAAEHRELSEYEILEMKNQVSGDARLLRVRVHFDPEAVMNTVGGIQAYAALKDIGTVMKAVPDFEFLYSDNYYPVVDYFVETECSDEEIMDLCDLPDMTLKTEIKVVKDSDKSSEPEKPARADNKKPETKSRASLASNTNSQKEKQDSQGSTTLGRFNSVLRVDSRRVDELMNLVSEAVINKATFNQINSVFSQILVDFQETTNKTNMKLKELFKSLPDIVEDAKNKKLNAKALKKQMSTQYNDLFTDYSELENTIKNSIGKFRVTSQSLGRITNELQEGVMRIRMVPVSQIFSRFPRLVRDLSRNLKKQVNLHLEGEETELDKSVIEDLIDPLIHCVRNSLDHGIETEVDRKQAGKPIEGNIYLRASNEGNMIVIEIEDDGRGIDVESVRQKAVKRKVIHPDKILSDIEAFNLIFHPGFSTAKEITNISGRGVGLDVVRKKIDKLNGSVSVWSEKGKGTKMTIRLPLTLAIIQGLLVRVGPEVYAIPITSVIESHRIKPEEIKLIDNYEVFNLRDEVISLLRLNRLFKINSDQNADYNYIVLVGAENNKVGLMVDSLIGEEDVVIKPLKDRYSNSPGIAGATILGDGTVSLIIDVGQLLDLGMKVEQSRRHHREAKIL
ncbi:MAG: chemotaxis protein CheA [Spirochaetales bacterium]|nr:chemotaxis protein CheA [Spirochaetales bacterium]